MQRHVSRYALASVDVMVHYLVDQLEGSSRNVLLGISNSVMLAEIKHHSPCGTSLLAIAV